MERDSSHSHLIQCVRVENMILRTDTIGHFEFPTEMSIRSAILYPGEKASKNDLVKLAIDDNNYLCIWIGKKEIGHTLELKIKSIKRTCKEKLDSKNAIQVMIKYLNGEIAWINEYLWDKSISQKLLENLQLLSRQERKPEQTTPADPKTTTRFSVGGFEVFGSHE